MSSDRRMLVIHVEFILDLLCPWCYIGKRNLDYAMDNYSQHHPDVTFDLTFKPYYLYPNITSSCTRSHLYGRIDNEGARLIQEAALEAGLVHGLILTGRSGFDGNDYSNYYVGPSSDPLTLIRLLREHYPRLNTSHSPHMGREAPPYRELKIPDIPPPSSLEHPPDTPPPAPPAQSTPRFTHERVIPMTSAWTGQDGRPVFSSTHHPVPQQPPASPQNPRGPAARPTPPLPLIQSACVEFFFQNHFHQGRHDISLPESCFSAAHALGAPAVYEHMQRRPEERRKTDAEAAANRQEGEAVPIITVQGRWRLGGNQPAQKLMWVFQKAHRNALEQRQRQSGGGGGGSGGRQGTTTAGLSGTGNESVEGREGSRSTRSPTSQRVMSLHDILH